MTAGHRSAGTHNADISGVFGFTDYARFCPDTGSRGDILSRAGSAIFLVRPVWRVGSGLVFLAAPRRPDTVAPGRRAPIFPAWATAPRRACARLPPSCKLTPDRPPQLVRVGHKSLCPAGRIIWPPKLFYNGVYYKTVLAIGQIIRGWPACPAPLPPGRVCSSSYREKFSSEKTRCLSVGG